MYLGKEKDTFHERVIMGLLVKMSMAFLLKIFTDIAIARPDNSSQQLIYNGAISREHYLSNFNLQQHKCAEKNIAL
jgi:hypothetical protein